MNNKRVSSITLTILTESPVALSNDQNLGPYTPIKKYFYKDGLHAMTSVSTVTYEMRKFLIKNKGLKPDDIVIKSKNLYPNEIGIEFDIFGYLMPKSQKSKTSPIRIIPFISVHKFNNDTQTITNRGFLDPSFGRKYYKEKDNKLDYLDYDDVPKTQALASEEVFGDYYTYTITLELDRIGVEETDEKGKYLPIDQRKYYSKGEREQIVKDILDAITQFTRSIKHQTVLLKPLAVFGGVFQDVIPYFWNDIEFAPYTNELILDNVNNTIADYELETDDKYLVLAVDRRIKVKPNEKIKDRISQNPVQAVKEIKDKIKIGDDNYWYLKG